MQQYTAAHIPVICARLCACVSCRWVAAGFGSALMKHVRLIEINKRPHSYWTFLHFFTIRKFNLFISHNFTLHFLSDCVTIFTIIWLHYLAAYVHIGPSILQQSLSPVIWSYTLQVCSNIYDERLSIFFFLLAALSVKLGMRFRDRSTVYECRGCTWKCSYILYKQLNNL
jgi:hypothetical protein